MTFDDLYHVIEALGGMLDAPEAARDVVHAMQGSLAEVRRLLHGVPPVTLYCELWANPMIAASRGSFEGHLLELAGGDNIATSLPGRSPRIGNEFVLQRDPAVILLPGGGVVPGLASPESIASRPGWRHLHAIEHGRVLCHQSCLLRASWAPIRPRRAGNRTAAAPGVSMGVGMQHAQRISTWRWGVFGLLCLMGLVALAGRVYRHRENPRDRCDADPVAGAAGWDGWRRF